MRGFYTSKPKIIKCVDCKIEIERLTPNHKRCRGCAYKIALKRATERMKALPEINRQNARDWYYRNRERKIKQVMEYQKLKRTLSPK